MKQTKRKKQFVNIDITVSNVIFSRLRFLRTGAWWNGIGILAVPSILLVRQTPALSWAVLGGGPFFVCALSASPRKTYWTTM